MYHSDLQKEIAYLQAQLDYKRRKLGAGLQQNVSLKDMEKLFEQIKEIELKLQVCFEESNTQLEGQ